MQNDLRCPFKSHATKLLPYMLTIVVQQ